MIGFDSIIIGSGPAGVSASLYIVRAGYSCAVFGIREKGSIMKAEKIENFYGVGSISGKELWRNGISQAISLGVQLFNRQIVSVNMDGNGGFVVETASGEEYAAKTVILALGVSKSKPSIDGFSRVEKLGGISYCAVCDGFFSRGKRVFVLGNGDYAVSEATYLNNLRCNVSILTNGRETDIKGDIPEGISVIKEKIDRIIGDELFEGVVLSGGEEIKANALFVAEGYASATDIAVKLGVKTESNKIAADEALQTNIKGVFACGDCIGGLLQVSKAVSDGAIAGTSAIRLLNGLKSGKQY